MHYNNDNMLLIKFNLAVEYKFKEANNFKYFFQSSEWLQWYGYNPRAKQLVNIGISEEKKRLLPEPKENQMVRHTVAA